MEMAKTVLTLQHRKAVARVEATRIRFSAHQCFARDDGDDDRRCLRLLADHLKASPGLAVCVHDGEFLAYLLRHAPDLRDHIRCVVRIDGPAADAEGFPVFGPESLPPEVQTVFLAETLTYPADADAQGGCRRGSASSNRTCCGKSPWNSCRRGPGRPGRATSSTPSTCPRSPSSPASTCC